MRTFRRDYPEYATGLFTETDGKDITAATLQVGLSTSNTEPPETWEWRDPDASSRPTPQTARVSLLIDFSVQAGDYFLWVKVTDNPEVLPRAATNARIHIV